MDLTTLDRILRPWKIIIPEQDNKALRKMLAAKGVVVCAKKPRSHLLRQLHRAHKGLVYYNNCTDEELRRFVCDRAIQSATSKRRHALIAALEEADDAIQFPRFLELPPELREMVYTEHFHFVGRVDRTCNHESPPILRINEVRYEALPLFNNTIAYEVKISDLEKDSGELKTPQNTMLELRRCRDHFLPTLRNEWLKFKKGTANARLFRVRCGELYDPDLFDITLYNCQQRGAYKISGVFSDAWRLGQRKAEMDGLIREEMTHFCDVLFGRIGQGEWDEAGFDELCAKLDIVVARAQAIRAGSDA